MTEHICSRIGRNNNYNVVDFGIDVVTTGSFVSITASFKFKLLCLEGVVINLKLL